jgi:osmoprotectant transport system permease protein
MSYILANPGVMLRLLGEHLGMAGTALLIATVLALPLSLATVRYPRWRGWIEGGLSSIYTIPSIALMILLLPLFGLGPGTVIAALALYALGILVRNFTAGLTGIDPAVLEAARGMGMSGRQIWLRVQLPLALPVMLAGERIAVVVSVAIATIGAKFGAGGLGTLLFDGIAQVGRYDKIWAGALSVAVLTWGLNYGLQRLERVLDLAGRARRAVQEG